MAATDTWPVIHGERKALAADLRNLSDGQWDTPSLCAGWTVRDVVTHMTAATEVGAGRWFVQLAASGFSLEKKVQKDVADGRGATPADVLARFEAQIPSTLHPPGPVDTWLGEVIVHAEDIRRPLGIGHAYPTAAVVRVADSYKRSNLVIGAKRRISGLTLLATDADWSHGEGPEVVGPVLALLLAMTGRAQALTELSGDGVPVLGERSGPAASR
jgi:uncharacterized protein (TIGR03083 family)